MHNKGSALILISDEYDHACSQFPPFHSPHEGYAILKEEVDELWEVIKCKGTNGRVLEKEAKQVGAMALRFLVDCCK